MEFLPNETHRVELNLPNFGKVMMCVDGKNNKWRVDPESESITDEEVRADAEEVIALVVDSRIRTDGYLPHFVPEWWLETAVTYAIEHYPGSSAILARNYEPEPEPVFDGPGVLAY